MLLLATILNGKTNTILSQNANMPSPGCLPRNIRYNPKYFRPHDEGPASSISANYIGFVIPGLGIAASSPFVLAVGDPLL